MTTGPNPYVSSVTSARAQIDTGLRSYMLRIYNIMGMGLAVSAAAAWITAHSPALLKLFYAARMTSHGMTLAPTLMGWIVILAPLALIFMIHGAAARKSAATVSAIYWAFVTLMGISLSTVLLQYDGASIIRAFLVTSCAFFGLGAWGYTTKRDLGPMASFMMMGLIGVIMASLLMFIWPSPMMDFVISVASVFIFSGLIAAKTQFIRHEYQTVAIHGGEMAAKSATLAALSLYLSFINLFLAILRLMNNR